MDRLLFWLGIGAAQKGAGSKPTGRRHGLASFVVGVLITAVIIVGMFLLLVSQKLWSLRKRIYDLISELASYVEALNGYELANDGHETRSLTHYWAIEIRNQPPATPR